MKQFFLRAKAWQIFSLLLVTPMISVAAEIAGSMYVSMAIMLVYAVAAFAWIWSLGTFLCALAPLELRLHLRFFYFAMVYPYGYASLVGWSFASSNDLPNAIVVPLHLLAMFCILYLLYFVAKGMAINELKRPVSFSDYAANFLLLWFYPIGVWVIQPKINALATSAATV